MTMNKDQAKGKAKEAVGVLTDDDQLQREGKADQAAGHAKEIVEHAADKVEDFVDKARDAARKH